MELIHHNHCPVCSSTEIHPLLTVKDHSVSGKEFVVWQCNQCLLRFTQDAPAEASIAPFYQSPDYISHTNSGTGLINRLYQSVRKFTLDQKASMVMNHTVSKGKLLDIGAGIGAFLNTMKRKGWEVSGIEPDEGARQKAGSLYNISLGDKNMFEKLPSAEFDAITLWHVLEHVHQLHPYLQRLRLLLKPGGKIFIAVPNYSSVDNSIYKVYWAAYDVPRHLYHFAPESMKALVERHGMRICLKKPMWFDSFYISLLSSRYKNGKPSWIGAGLSGIRSNLAAIFNKNRCSSLIYIIEKDQ